MITSSKATPHKDVKSFLCGFATKETGVINISEIDLSALKEGESCIIEGHGATDIMAKPLKELGFIRGTRVTCLLKSFAGDPTAYLVKGAVIALRREDAANIKVCR